MEFDKIPWDKTVVMFGCSNMFGIGLALKDTIPAQFTALTGIPAINLGVPGSSLQYSMYNSAIFKKLYPKPRAVVVDIPDASRCALFLPEGDLSFRPVHCGSWTEDMSGLGKSWRRFDSMLSCTKGSLDCVLNRCGVTFPIQTSQYFLQIRE